MTPPCGCGHPADDHDDDGACMHLCDCAWPDPEFPQAVETGAEPVDNSEL